jgi:hypothetical protein
LLTCVNSVQNYCISVISDLDSGSCGKIVENMRHLKHLHAPDCWTAGLTVIQCGQTYIMPLIVLYIEVPKQWSRECHGWVVSTARLFLFYWLECSCKNEKNRFIYIPEKRREPNWGLSVSWAANLDLESGQLWPTPSSAGRFIAVLTQCVQDLLGVIFLNFALQCHLLASWDSWSFSCGCL